IAAMSASLTVGLKRAGKSIAIKKATNIIYLVGKVIYYFERFTGLNLTEIKKNNHKKNRIE
ncbi:MAG: hypothetical protein WCS44_06035, partial [Bacillota bacterium]